MTFTDIFVYVPYAFFALACATFVFRCGFSPLAKSLWAAWLLLAFSKFGCFLAISGTTAFNPEIPSAVLIVWDAAFVGAFVLSVLSTVFIFRFRYRGIVLPAVAWTLAAVSVYCGVAAPDVREVTVRHPDVPALLDGYRLVQITDLHCSSALRRWRTEKVVERANALGADLICLTGDYVDGLVKDRAADLEPLTELEARDGVYYVSGNHEYYRDRGWMAWFRGKGMRFLENECVFPRPGLALGGVSDVVTERYGGVTPDVRKAFAAAGDGDFRILLQHRPRDAARNIGEYGVDLQLSGHTHGGVAPLIRNVVAKANGGFVLGMYRIGEGFLYVSPGTGQWAGILSRLFNPSEITLITLVRADS